MPLAVMCLFYVVDRVVAASGPATIAPSSVYDDRYEARNAIDGDRNTRWASKPVGKATLTLDFGKTVSIDRLTIRWERAYSPVYQIQVSAIGKRWTTLVHQRNGKGGDEAWAELDGKGRYFRINCLEASRTYRLASIWEIDFSNSEIREILKTMHDSGEPPPRPAMPLAEAKAKLAEHGIREIVFSARADGNDGHWYANLGYWAHDENAMLYGKEGRLCKLDVATATMVILIDDPDGTIRDPVVHYDADKVLFSWRKADSKVFHLYECDLNGTNIRQITDGAFDDIEPCYLPDGGIVFVSTRARRYVNCWLTQVATLYRCDGDGDQVRQLSANVEHDNTPWVLPDGRILYQRWEYVDRSQVSFHHLWTMNPDGTGQMVYYGNLNPGGLYIDAKPIPGSDDVLLINSPGHGRREHSGHVAIVNNRLGPDHRGALNNISRGSNYRDPWPVSTGLFLVAKGRTIAVMDGYGGETPIFSLPPELGKTVNLQEPRPVIAREREHVTVSRVDLTQSTGTLVLQDVHVGRNMGDVKRGEIRKLLVLESLPKPINFTGGMDPLTYGGSFTLERVLGTVPVEKDGSAFMELPANRSLFLVALDKDSNSVKRMQSFLTVMPGEVQSCVGCHEQRGTTPIGNMPRKQLLALQRPPSRPSPIVGVPDVLDFPRDIQPILDKHCIRCHSARKRSAGIVLTGDHGPMFSHSYVTLTLKKQFADGRNLARSNYAPRAIGTSASPIMRKLNGEHHGVKVAEAEQDLIRYWIETGATYPGTYASLGHGAIGGYQRNRQINHDKDWPTAKAFTRVVEKRCIGCHTRTLKLPIPRTMSDEMGISFWRFSTDDKRLRFSRHLMFDLSRPDQSLFLLGPLAKEAGGLGLCKGAAFTGTDDPDYQALLAHVVAGKEFLETRLTRFDMPSFKPRPEYFREMKRYGIVPPSFDAARDAFDVYELDQAYWASLWYRPLAKQR